MSLNAAQQARTREELGANYRLSGRTPEAVHRDLGFTADRLDDTLHIRPGSDPADVWLLRDYLEREIRTAGGTPTPYTVLTEQARAAADRWFALHRLPAARTTA